MSKIVSPSEKQRIYKKYNFPPEGSFEHEVSKIEIDRLIQYEMKKKRKKPSFPVKEIEKREKALENKSENSREKPVDAEEIEKREKALEDKSENSREKPVDAEVGNISSPSVSSVHTSDLSSFDDEVSFSSNEELGMKRKKVSLKSFQKLYNEGKIQEWCKENLQHKTRT